MRLSVFSLVLIVLVFTGCNVSSTNAIPAANQQVGPETGLLTSTLPSTKVWMPGRPTLPYGTTDVSVAQLSSGSVVKTLHFDLNSGLIVTSPDQHHVYVPATLSGTLYVFDVNAATYSTRRIAISTQPYARVGAMNVSPDGRSLYVQSNNRIYGISTVSWAITRSASISVATCACSHASAISADGRTLFFPTVTGVEAIDAITFAVKDRADLPAGAHVSTLAMRSDTSDLLYGIEGTYPFGYFDAWSSSSLSLMHRIPIQGAPNDMDIDTTLKRAYITAASNVLLGPGPLPVYVINLDTNGMKILFPDVPASNVSVDRITHTVFLGNESAWGYGFTTVDPTTFSMHFYYGVMPGAESPAGLTTTN